ncbi:MAG TPA: hypothetical protein P5081_16775 [Phycisphaerae bacterium]|nr:hypothetical protein [Phycisphaerae bacterium]HRW54526.1 hypothetical protein [Phycisphaerae bacterium]
MPNGVADTALSEGSSLRNHGALLTPQRRDLGPRHLRPNRSRRPLFLNLIGGLILVSGAAVVGCGTSGEGRGAGPAETDAIEFARLPEWDDGLAELCYYDAIDTIYSEPRSYTRVMLMNREWLNPGQMVKTERTKDASSLPVFKMNLIEEIPTQNYNYRYMVTTFLGRPDLRLEKLAASSQEWCGVTFKRLARRTDGLALDTFSYFEGEADRHWTLPADDAVYPVEAVFALARQVASTGKAMRLQLLPTMRSTHTCEPALTACALSREASRRCVCAPFGDVQTHRITLAEASGTWIASYDVEAAAPYRIIRYEDRDNLRLTLRFAERRAYWDRNQPSRFYPQGKAP